MRGEISCTHTNCLLEANKRQTIANGSLDSRLQKILFITAVYSRSILALGRKTRQDFVLDFN